MDTQVDQEKGGSFSSSSSLWFNVHSLQGNIFMDVNTQVTGWKKYRSVVRRNFVSVFFPVFVASCIFLDWNRTQRFKKQRTLEAAANSS
ncbi:hypothetical protein ACOMHN_019634 [Nucella lapillus]